MDLSTVAPLVTPRSGSVATYDVLGHFRGMAKKRYLTRHPVVLRVQVRMREGWRDGVVFDASRGGIFLQIDPVVPQASIVQLRIGLPNGHVIDAMAEVRSSIPDASIDPRGPGIGVRFMTMSASDKRQWEHFLPRPGTKPPEAAVQAASYIDGVIPSVTLEEGQVPGLAAAVAAAKKGHVPPLAKAPLAPPAPATVPPTTPAPAMSKPTLQPNPPARVRKGASMTRKELGAAIKEVVATRVRLQRQGRGAQRQLKARPWAAKPKAEQQSEQTKTPVAVGPSSQAAGRPAPAAAEPKPKRPTESELDHNQEWLTLRYVPADVATLRNFVDNCLKEGEAFIPTESPARINQPFGLSITHPGSGEKLRVFGRVSEVVDDDQGKGVVLVFTASNDTSDETLDRFVGDRDVKMQRRRRHAATMTRLKRTMQEAPQSCAATVAMAWFHLLDDRDEEKAIAVFMDALALEPTNAEIYNGLALAHALAGNAARAVLFAKSAIRFTTT